MSLDKLKLTQLDSTSASDGDVVTYVSANSSFEVAAGSSGGAGVTVHNVATTNDFVDVDTSGNSDGSLHFLRNQNKLYVWDQTDNAYYQVTTSSTTLQKVLYAGDIAGHVSGGKNPYQINTMEKFPFSSDTASSDVGESNYGWRAGVGNNDPTRGYMVGGGTGPNNSYGRFVYTVNFTSDEPATNIGNIMPSNIAYSGGFSSATHAFRVGGSSNSSNSPSYLYDSMSKFPFASADSSVATDIGEISQARNSTACVQTMEVGYALGGVRGTPSYSTYTTNVIDKVLFSSDTNGTDIGDLYNTGIYQSGTSSTTNGYVNSSQTSSSGRRMTYFNFSSESSGSQSPYYFLGQGVSRATGHSSTTSGYIIAGSATAGNTGNSDTYYNSMQKFNFSSGGASFIANMINSRSDGCGMQD